MVDISSSAPRFISRGFFLGHRFMLNFTRSGSIADAIAAARGVPSSVIPYAAATALTRTAYAGRDAVRDRMPAVFDRPTRYTLNALRVDGATKTNLTARVAVKNQATGTGTRPESYLLPEVEGGPRSEKRFERALRYSGVLSSGQRVMPGSAASLDAQGNVSAREISRILSALKRVRGDVNAAGQRKGRGRKLQNDLFVGMPSVGSGAARRARAGAASGIYRREGRRIRPLFIFTDQRPTYRQRLDFAGTVQPVVLDRFRAEFERAATDILNRRRR